MTYTATINVTGGIFQKTVEELNGHEQMTILLPNTVANRTLVAADQSATLVWTGPVTLFEGTCTGAKHTRGMLECICYNEAYEILQRSQPFNTSYTTTAASVILTALGAHVGIAVTWHGADPNVSIRFDYANCMDVLIALAECTGNDYWTTTGPLTIHIGTRGAAAVGVSALEGSTRILDRAKQRNNVRIRGVDAAGNVIYGTANAGAADRYSTFTERRPSDQATLDALAAKKLADLNKDTGPSPLAVSTVVGNALYPGDTVTLAETHLQLSGDFRLWKVERYIDKVMIYPEAPDKTVEKSIWDTRRYEDLGIYISSAEQIPTGMQTFSTNLEFRPKAAAPATTVEWDDGAAGDATIRFADGTVETINKDDSAALAAGDHWVYYIVGSNDLTVTDDYTDVNGPGKVFIAQLIVPTVVAGQTQYVEIIPQYSRGLNVGTTIMSAGVIITPDFRTSYNVGVALGPAGIRISSTEIAGYSGGVVKEFYIGVDGKAYFGGGSVVADAVGLTIDGGGLLLIKDGGGNLVGGMSGALGAFSFGNANNAQINITAVDGDLWLASTDAGGTYLDGGTELVALRAMESFLDGDTNFGTSTRRWGTIFSYLISLLEGLTDDHTASGLIVRDTVGEAVVFGTMLYMKADGKWWKSDADADTTMPIGGMALETKAAESESDILLLGFVRDDSLGLAVGGSAGLIYGSAAVGEITQAQPAGAGDQVQVLGFAITATIWLFFPSYVLVERS